MRRRPRPATAARVRVSPDVLVTWERRLALVARALGSTAVDPVRASSLPEFVGRLGDVIDVTDRSHVWLAISALSGCLPDDRTVERACREMQLSGPEPLVHVLSRLSTPESLSQPVEVVTDEVVVDVQHTAGTDLATGIQRVARETARRWALTQACRLLAWTDGFTALRSLTGREAARMLGTPAEGSPPAVRVVPWRSTYLVPELAADPERTSRLLALARHSGNRTGVIGFDTVPVTSADTSSSGFPGFFANYLAAIRHFDEVSTISRAAATEFDGWRQMLAAVGLPGPAIEPILLPAEAPEPSATATVRAAHRFLVGRLPMILCVGTHEPRKNHLSVLHAAELLWDEGLQFSLTFVGGHSWSAERFSGELARLQQEGRPVDTASGVPDDELWAAYRLARFTVFPSFNEGFGLPAAESLAAGTPVITSGFGSMAEIAADGGALLVDPRDDRSVVQAMRRLLTEDDTLTELRAAARARPLRSWDDYAAENWRYLTGR